MGTWAWQSGMDPVGKLDELQNPGKRTDGFQRPPPVASDARRGLRSRTFKPWSPKTQEGIRGWQSINLDELLW
jgi:hypothetical protein